MLSYRNFTSSDISELIGHIYLPSLGISTADVLYVAKLSEFIKSSYDNI